MRGGYPDGSYAYAFQHEGGLHLIDLVRIAERTFERFESADKAGERWKPTYLTRASLDYLTRQLTTALDDYDSHRRAIPSPERPDPLRIRTSLARGRVIEINRRMGGR